MATFNISMFDVSPARDLNSPYPAAGGSAPVLTWLNPLPGASIGKNDTLNFTIADNSLALTILSVQFPASGVQEVVFRDGAFTPSYATDSTSSASTALGITTTTFHVKRQGGWPTRQTIRFQIDSADSGGQVI